MPELDNSNGVLFICYDPDTQMVYLCGKVTTVRVIGEFLLNPLGIQQYVT